jgi:hypothetical protein
VEGNRAGAAGAGTGRLRLAEIVGLRQQDAGVRSGGVLPGPHRSLGHVPEARWRSGTALPCGRHRYRGGRYADLDERFRYDDGETQTRVWTLVRQSDNSWRGRAGDVIGEAIGQTAGNALHWNYTLLPVDDKQYEVQMDDWMYQMDERTLINRTSMSKFGVEVGQVTLFFRKEAV